MATMKAVVCTRYGPPEALQIAERERPQPRADEVLVRVRATSVTDSDIFIRSGRVEWKVIVPFRLMMGITRPRREILGEVLAGEIIATGGNVTRLKPGDHVYGLTGFSLGAYAEYVCLRDLASKFGGLAVKPKNVSFEEATALAYGGLLALQALEKGGIRRGDRILLYGAASTSGTIAVQYAKHLGARVTGVCSMAKADLVRSLGAEATIDYRNDDAVLQLEQYDLVVDTVGKRRTSALREACKARTPKGRILSIDDGSLEIAVDRLDRIRALAEAGVLHAVTDRCYPLERIAEAHRYVAMGHKTGNVAVTIG